MSDFLDLQGAKDLNTDAIHIGAVANSVDPVTGAAIDTHVNRVGGTNRTFAGLEADFDAQLAAQQVEFIAQLQAQGWNPVAGSFESGGTLVNRRDIMWWESAKAWYSWQGALPKVVPAGSTPATAGGVSPTAWVDRTDGALRSELAEAGGADMIGFQQAGSGSVYRSVQDKLWETVSVKDFGAVGDGVTDDTSAIQAALSHIYTRKLALFFPAGIYLYDGGGALGDGNILFGEGRNATTIKSRLASPTSGYLIHALGYGAGIRGLRFEAAVTQTAGSYVWLSGRETFVEDFYMTGDFNGVWMTGNVSRIRHGRFQDGAPSAIRIKAEGGDNSQLIDDVLMGAQVPQVSAAGIRVRNSSALIISNTSVIQQGTGLLIDPYSHTAGSSTVDTDSGDVYSLYAHHCFFDNSLQSAVAVNTTGNASVVRIRFDNCWMGSSASDGITIVNRGTGTLQGVHFESCHVGLSGGAGLTTGGTVSDIQVLGGWFCQNVYGLYFNNGASNITVSGCTIGSGAGLSGNTNNGIVLGHASINNVIITNNRMVGNGYAAMVDNSAGANKIIFNNTGTSSVGTSIDISGPAGGQIRFPATQNPSADVNTLDDYEEGTWIPTLSFATPGDLSVSYASKTGKYTKIGRMVVVNFQIVTSAFTWTTASGALTISGLPFMTDAIGGFEAVGSLASEGITKASYTMFFPSAIAGSKTMLVRASGSGQAYSNVVAADVPSGGSVTLIGTVTYFV